MKDKFNYFVDKEVKKEIKCYSIDIPIYKCSVNIIFDKEAKKLEKDWNKSVDGYGGLTRDFLKENGSVLISFPKSKPKIEYVVHEFYHATNMIMNYIGHKSDYADEPSAYLIGYLTKEYLKIKK